MAKVMKRAVGVSQQAFVEGRQILDTTIIPNEIVEELKYKNLEGCEIG